VTTNTDRATACVNALAGVEDPNTIPTLIEAVRLLLVRLEDGHEYPSDISVAIATTIEAFNAVNKPQDTSVRPMYDLSTAHVKRGDDGEPDFGGVRFMDHRYGWTVFVTEYYDECPDWLYPIMRAAHQMGAILINFDSDAPRCTNFTAYEDIQ